LVNSSANGSALGCPRVFVSFRLACLAYQRDDHQREDEEEKDGPNERAKAARLLTIRIIRHVSCEG
jgi:hypothetical protein